MEFLNNGAISIEGTPEQIANQLIQGFIGPAYDAMEKIDKTTADLFAYQIAGKTIAAHLFTVEAVSVDEAAQCLKDTIDEILIDIKAGKALKNPASKKKS